MSNVDGPFVTRVEAKERGLKTYFTGDACAEGHISERRTNTGYCISCRSEQNARWRAENPDRMRALMSAWRASNPEYAKQASVAWRKNNPELAASRNKEYKKKMADAVRKADREWKAANIEWVRERARIWHAKYGREKAKSRGINYRHIARENSRRYREMFPERKKAVDSQRRARLAGSSGCFTRQDVLRLQAVQHHKCAYCKTNIRSRYHVDHIMPLALGGSNEPRNIQLLCPTCNLSKGPKHPIDFALQRGMLV